MQFVGCLGVRRAEYPTAFCASDDALLLDPIHVHPIFTSLHLRSKELLPTSLDAIQASEKLGRRQRRAHEYLFSASLVQRLGWIGNGCHLRMRIAERRNAKISERQYLRLRVTGRGQISVLPALLSYFSCRTCYSYPHPSVTVAFSFL